MCKAAQTILQGASMLVLQLDSCKLPRPSISKTQLRLFAFAQGRSMLSSGVMQVGYIKRTEKERTLIFLISVFAKIRFSFLVFCWIFLTVFFHSTFCSAIAYDFKKFDKCCHPKSLKIFVDYRRPWSNNNFWSLTYCFCCRLRCYNLRFGYLPVYWVVYMICLDNISFVSKTKRKKGTFGLLSLFIKAQKNWYGFSFFYMNIYPISFKTFLQKLFAKYTFWPGNMKNL